MSFTSTDWAIDYDAQTVTNDDSGTGDWLPAAFGDNTHVGPILDFFQWLAAEFAATSQMDDDYGIESQTPTVFKWLSGWTFGHADDFKYLEGGSIEDPSGSGTTTADSLWANLYSIGDQEEGTQLALYQDDSEVTPWWITGNLDILVLVKDTGAWVQSDNTAGTPTDGGLWIYARETGDFFDHNFADLSGGGRSPIGINTAPDGNNTSGELYLSLTSATNFTVGSFVVGGTSGAVGKIISVSSNDIYLNAVRGGPFVISETIVEYDDRELQTIGDGSTTNDGTTAFTNVVAGYTDILYAFVTITFTGGTTGSGPYTIGETVTQTGSGATGKFAAEVSNALFLEEVTGTFNATGLLTGGSSGAEYTPTGTAGATEADMDLNNGAGVQPYNCFVDLASRPVDEWYEYSKYITRYGSTSTTFQVNGDDGQEYRSAIEGTYAEVKVAPFGTLAGSTYYGARGIWVTDYTIADFVLKDADNVTQAPPDYQKVTASHTSLSGTNVFVAELTGDGGTIIKDQYVYDDTPSDATHLHVTLDIDINKTPQSGVVRVGDTQYVYTSFTGKIFTVTSDPTGETDASDVYVPLLDVLADAASEQSDNIIYSGTPFWCRTVTRKYGYKPFTQDAQFGATGLPFTPILATDPQAT